MTNLKLDSNASKVKLETTENYAVLFDMDGVLVDVTNSYRRTVQDTVNFFTGDDVLPTEIQDLKEHGGYNNDWDLTEALLRRRCENVPKTEIIAKFQELYLGAEGKKGLIENEKWLLPKEKLEALHARHSLGIVTGRPELETFYVLGKFRVKSLFDVVVTMEDYPPEKAKPDPFPIMLALERLRTREAIYVGDSVDDIAAAQRAGIKAFGCIPPQISPRALRNLLLRRGAEKVLERIEDINNALP